MADDLQDDELLRELMGNMDSSPKSSPQSNSSQTSSNKFNSEGQIENDLPVKIFSKENLLIQFEIYKKKLKGAWQLPFMIASIVLALFIWSYLPSRVAEEDQIHEPEWWFQKAMYYYKIAEDKGLQNSYPMGDFSRYEFSTLSFDKQKELFKNLKRINGFQSNPNIQVQSQFLNTFVNDLNKLLLDDALIKKIPSDAIDKISKLNFDRISDGLSKSVKATENAIPSLVVNNIKLLNRELLESAFELIPKNKPARIIAAKYFRYVFDKHPATLNNHSSADLLKVADSFSFVVGDNISKKEKLKIYLNAYNKNNPYLEGNKDIYKGGQGEQLVEKNIEDSDSLSLEDQAHMEYMIANLYFDLNNNNNAQKYFKRFLDLALEKSSEGFERRVEKDIVFFDSNKKSILHREINQQKINDAYFKLGTLQFQNDEFEEAKNNLEQFITKSLVSDPEKSFLANQILGDLYMTLKNYDKALYYYKKSLNVNAINLNQMNPVKYKTGLANYRLGDYSKAIERFKQVNGTGEFAKFNAAALFYTGKAYQLLGDEENSFEIFKRVRERFPLSDEEIAATFEVAKFHFKKGMYDVAFSEPIGVNHEKKSSFDYSIKTLLDYPIERFLNNEFLDVSEILIQPESNSQEIGLLYDLANVFTSNKQYEKAIDVYTLMTSNPLAIHQMGSKRDKLYFDMAKIWAENGAPIRAGETLEIMLEKIPDTPFYAKALWDICKYYMSKNDYGRALKPLRQFTGNFYGRPESPESNYLLGICEQKVGDFDQAIESYNKAYGYINWKPTKNVKDLQPNETPEEDPYYVLNRPENHIDRNFYAYQAIYQKGEAYKDVGLYDLAIDHIYRTVFNDPLYRFSPTSEIWKKSLLVYANSYFNKGWQEKNDLKLKVEFFEKAEKSYKDYIERYKVAPSLGLGEELDKMQKIKWEEFDKTIFSIYYNLAFIKFELKEYEKARDIYIKITKWPMDNWTNSNRDEKKKDAFLMIPLTYYNESKWAEAIIAYRDAKDRYASSSEAPTLGMRIGECLQNLGDYANAKLEFDASKWALELANNNLFKDKPGDINKQYWDDLIRLKKNNLDWLQKSPAP